MLAISQLNKTCECQIACKKHTVKLLASPYEIRAVLQVHCTCYETLEYYL